MSKQWIAVADADRVTDGEVVGVKVEGRSIAVYNVGGAYFATAGVCTHQEFRLCDGFLDGYEIECPLHQGRFDVRSGRALCAPVTQDLEVYETRVEGRKILIALPET